MSVLVLTVVNKQIVLDGTTVSQSHSSNVTNIYISGGNFDRSPIGAQGGVVYNNSNTSGKPKSERRVKILMLDIKYINAAGNIAALL